MKMATLLPFLKAYKFILRITSEPLLIYSLADAL